jgi:hypothetical protein
VILEKNHEASQIEAESLRFQFGTLEKYSGGIQTGTEPSRYQFGTLKKSGREKISKYPCEQLVTYNFEIFVNN